MKNLIIIGAGGYGKEAFTLAKNSMGYGSKFRIKGYLDSNLLALEDEDTYPSILDTVENYEVIKDDIFICAIHDVNIRRKTVAQILKKGGVFTNLVHSSVYLGDGVVLGKGVFIAYDVVISNDTVIEDYVLLNSRSVIGHNCIIKKFASVGVLSFVGGGVSIGEGSTVNSKASIKNNIVIGDNAIVGIGSVIIKDVEDSIVMFGNPAKMILKN